MESIIFFICFYFIGFIFALMIYDVKYYIKYDGNIINKFNKKELINSLIILLSWIYLIYQIIKLTRIIEIMKNILRKVWDNYCEAMYLAYYPYYIK